MFEYERIALIKSKEISAYRLHSFLSGTKPYVKFML